MGRYNNFIAVVECPSCHRSSEVEFQADIGRLEWIYFHPGDEVFGHSKQTKRAPVGPAPNLDNSDFWAYGIGVCMNCNSDVYARIEIRSNRVDKIVVVPPPIEDEAFDFLNQWGFLTE